MRQLRKNKQKMYYALYKGKKTIYAHDDDYLITQDGRMLLTEDGIPILNSIIMTTPIDGKLVPVIDAEKETYSVPALFMGNISFDSGETRLDDYGLNPGDYNAVISADKGKLPFDERTLIWFESELEYDKHGDIKPETADYRVIAIKTSLNEQRFLLKRRVDD